MPKKTNDTEDNITHRITEKGLAWLALNEAGISIGVDDERFHQFWDIFKLSRVREHKRRKKERRKEKHDKE